MELRNNPLLAQHANSPGPAEEVATERWSRSSHPGPQSDVISSSPDAISVSTRLFSSNVQSNQAPSLANGPEDGTGNPSIKDQWDHSKQPTLYGQPTGAIDSSCSANPFAPLQEDDRRSYGREGLRSRANTEIQSDEIPAFGRDICKVPRCKRLRRYSEDRDPYLPLSEVYVLGFYAWILWANWFLLSHFPGMASLAWNLWANRSLLSYVLSMGGLNFVLNFCYHVWRMLPS
ncbi:hypothetical protein Nepgr_031726 [Nepenthes gracilis]|uniref:Uncharacterized protein n=1 Tax=Nepenthes gracilis TaxID=150966 RepID=A0AAD3THA0_NEPGR|nr:hypothetical protein Nepgr_031726 [Nepenthes gracilis]